GSRREHRFVSSRRWTRNRAHAAARERDKMNPTASFDERPLIAHVIYRFDVGGLENGLVNLVNRMPEDAYRHAIVALTEITDFRKRVLRDDVKFFALHKQPGHA